MKGTHLRRRWLVVIAAAALFAGAFGAALAQSVDPPSVPAVIPTPLAGPVTTTPTSTTTTAPAAPHHGGMYPY